MELNRSTAIGGHMDKEKSVGTMAQKIGHITYTVSLYTSSTSKETMSNKVLRLARNNQLKRTSTAV